MSEIPNSTLINNPITQLIRDKIIYALDNKNFNEYIPLQDGFLFWKKNYMINSFSPEFLDIKKELEGKGYEVEYYPYKHPHLHPLPANTKIKIIPRDSGKNIIQFDNNI